MGFFSALGAKALLLVCPLTLLRVLMCFSSRILASSSGCLRWKNDHVLKPDGCYPRNMFEIYLNVLQNVPVRFGRCAQLQSLGAASVAFYKKRVFLAVQNLKVFSIVNARQLLFGAAACRRRLAAGLGLGHFRVVHLGGI